VRIPTLISLGLLACGGNSVHHLADGGGDAPRAPDASPDAPTTGVVTITVTVKGVGAANVPVYFQNADSTVVSDTTTDGSGVATATMRAGGFVSVIEPTVVVANAVVTEAGASLLTFSGVKPGDQLRDDLQPPTVADVPTTVNIVAPIDTNKAVTAYELVTTCGSVGLNGPIVGAVGSNLPPTNVTLENCNGTADMVVEGLNGSGAAVDSFFEAGVALGSGSGSAATIVLTGPYAAVGQQVFTFTDIPDEVATVSVEDELATTRGALTSDGTTSFANTTGAGSATLPTLSRDAAIIAGYEYDLAPAGSIDDSQKYVQWGAEPASVALDIGSLALRHWETAPQLDPASEAVTWSVGTTGASPDYYIAAVSASRTGSGSAGTSTWHWLIAAGSDAAGSIPFPTVPTDVFDFNFRDTDSLDVDAVGAVQAPGGYDAVRATASTTIVEQVVEPLVFVTSASTGSFASQITTTKVTEPGVVRRKAWR
jgi:hypothetical protein